ncbi:MAG: hypothetical protein BroJett011_42120 [Chloroflexota bacterium]|nr:MAG: hypothetical protein BroJett011_42120 [Chloroflexota bacterium]
MPLSAPYESFIKDYLALYWEQLTEEAAHGLPVPLSFPQIPETQLLQCELAQDLTLIAQGATGELSHDEETERRLAVAIERVLSRLFPGIAISSAPVLRSIPGNFWASDLGKMVARARLWLAEDDLITIKDAASLKGVSLAAIRQAIDRGTLAALPNPDAPNPRRRGTLLRRSEVVRWSDKIDNDTFD